MSLLSALPSPGRSVAGVGNTPAGVLADVAVPAIGDWTDQGVVLSPGTAGSWNARLSGAFSPCTTVKIGATLYLCVAACGSGLDGPGGVREHASGGGESHGRSPYRDGARRRGGP